MKEDESPEPEWRMGLKKLKQSRALLNAGSSVALQIVTIVNGLIVPRLILETFGSELNGLVLSINQFLSYISLAEGGVTGVVSASLYKALKRHDAKRVNSIYVTMALFCKRIVGCFLVYAAIVSIAFALCFRGTFGFWKIFALVWVLAFVQIVQYGFALAPRTLLNADKKVYIVSFTQIGMSVLSLILVLLCVHVWPNILVLKIATGLCYLVQPIVYSLAIRQQYGWRLFGRYEVKVDNKLLKKRWDGFTISLAAFIHNNTDIVILTLFTNYLEVSVYGVYLMVTAGIRGLVQAVSRGIAPSLGHVYASGDKENLRRCFAKYRLGMFSLVACGFVLAFVLIRPFISLYTHGINDAEYDRPVFAALILLAEMFYLLREAHVNLAYAAGKFKELSRVCMAEAFVNISVSLVAVQFYGLEGVAFGTLVAMAGRTIYQIWFSRKILGQGVT